ncbi:MAG TPA: efflux RND transporter periplasmic adaptor subunit [Brumimicrobium sp.]|nr:efflux RND transporter periplasmic adaptor subunit [Brumimicrobium sp.]
MKSNHKTGILIVIVILLYIGVFWFLMRSEKSTYEEATLAPKQFQLMEVKSDPLLNGVPILGQITPERTTKVTMEVNGKIDDDNRVLAPGNTFKKNEILLKVERTEILYELLALRANFKETLLSSLEAIRSRFPEEKGKWEAFANSVNRLSTLPELPKINSEEDALITELKIPSLYHHIKSVEKKAEKYFYAAPFDGIIIDSKVQPESIVRQNSPLMTIAKNNSFVINTTLSLSMAKFFQTAQEKINVISNNEIMGTAKYHSTKPLNSDSTKVNVVFTTSIQEGQHLNKIVELQTNIKNQDTWLPKSVLTKGNQVILFNDNQTFHLTVTVLNQTKDSVQLKGLPHHFFIVTNP